MTPSLVAVAAMVEKNGTLRQAADGIGITTERALAEFIRLEKRGFVDITVNDYGAIEFWPTQRAYEAVQELGKFNPEDLDDE